MSQSSSDLSCAADVDGDLPAEFGVDASFAKVYKELRALAHRELGRVGGNTLHTTELVHEAYVKLALNESLRFANDFKFFKYVAVAMRHILIDRASRRARAKFGGIDVHVDLDSADLDSLAASPMLLLQLDAALRELEVADERAAKVVELHYFAGLPLERIAEFFDVSRRTIDRDWAFARAFLESHVPDAHSPD